MKKREAGENMFQFVLSGFTFDTWRLHHYHPNIYANTSGATIVASLSMIYFGV